MSFVDHAARQLNCKILYFGPRLAGKASNLGYIHADLRPELRSKLVCLPGESGHDMVFFDFTPDLLPRLRGLRLRLHLYAMHGPGLSSEDDTFMLRGTDVGVFVVDSRSDRIDEAARTLERYQVMLADRGRPDATPLIVQYNHRDHPDALPLAELDARLNPGGRPRFAAIASRGDGVFATLTAAIVALVQRR